MYKGILKQNKSNLENSNLEEKKRNVAWNTHVSVENAISDQEKLKPADISFLTAIARSVITPGNNIDMILQGDYWKIIKDHLLDPHLAPSFVANRMDKYYFTLLEYARVCEHDDAIWIANKLIEMGVQIPSTDDKLQHAALNDDWHIIHSFFQNGLVSYEAAKAILLKYQRYDRILALDSYRKIIVSNHIFDDAKNGNWDSVFDRIVQEELTVNITNTLDQSLLDFANEDIKIIERLYQHGYNMNAAVLQYARLNAWEMVVIFVKHHWVDINCHFQDNKTLLDWALVYKADCYAFLEEQGAKHKFFQALNNQENVDKYFEKNIFDGLNQRDTIENNEIQNNLNIQNPSLTTAFELSIKRLKKLNISASSERTVDNVHSCLEIMNETTHETTTPKRNKMDN